LFTYFPSGHFFVSGKACMEFDEGLPFVFDVESTP